jgi:hypothetical protein
MPEPRIAMCLFCDDIRAEVGNKISLMGIYGGDLIINTAPQPTPISHFGVVIYVITDVDDVPGKISVTVHMPPDHLEIVKLDMSDMPALQNPDGAIKAQFRAFLPLPPFTIGTEGFVEVIADVDGKAIRAGRLRVRFAPPGESQ